MKVIITSEAEKQFTKLQVKDRKRVQKKLLVLEHDPLSGRKLKGEYSRLRVVRAWPYRIIYWVNMKSETIFIVSIIHGQGAYN